MRRVRDVVGRLAVLLERDGGLGSVGLLALVAAGNRPVEGEVVVAESGDFTVV